MAKHFGPDYDPNAGTYNYGGEIGGDGIGVAYSQWDKDMTKMCACDDQFFGASCNLRMCAKGDDPLTTSQDNRKFQLEVSSASSALSGKIGVTFGRKTGYFDISSTANDKQCVAGVRTFQFHHYFQRKLILIETHALQSIFIFYSNDVFRCFHSFNQQVNFPM